MNIDVEMYHVFQGHFREKILMISNVLIVLLKLEKLSENILLQIMLQQQYVENLIIEKYVVFLIYGQDFVNKHVTKH